MPHTPNNGTLHRISDGQEIKRGDTVKDFRGDDLIVKDWYPPGQAARGARIECVDPAANPNFSRLLYTGVINAEIRLGDEVFRS